MKARQPAHAFCIISFLFIFLIIELFRISPQASMLWLVFLAACIWSIKKDGYLEKIFGFLIPLAPIFGSGSLLACALLYLLFRSKKADLANENRWALPFFLVLGLWAGINTIYEFDLVSCFTIAEGGFREGLSGIWHWLHFSPPKWIIRWEGFSRYFVLASLFALWRNHDLFRKNIVNGLLIGLFISLVLTSTQKLGFCQGLFVQQSVYWTSISRITGTFTDPNAFGVFIGLAIPFLIGMSFTSIGLKQLLAWLLSLSWLFLACFSGSRTYFLGLFLYVFFWTLKRGATYVLFGGLCVLALIGGINFLSPEVNQLSIFPIGVQRLFQSLNWSHMEEAFSSRIIFWKIAGSVWLDNLFFGVGFENFRDVVFPYSKKLGLNIGGWTDNANNFYLGLLAETGIIGFLSLIFSLAKLKFNKTTDSISGFLRYSLLALPILLVVGPHLDFDEVSIFTAFLLASTTVIRGELPRRSGMITTLLYLFVSVGIFYKASTLERGFYQWEFDGHNHFRWTERRAFGYLNCDGVKQAHLKVRAVHPDLEKMPVTIRIKTKDEDITSSFSQPGEREFSFSCPKGKDNLLYYNMSLSRSWVPRRYSLGEDSRVLGVQVMGE